jgi:hypothetical protein
VKESKSLDGGPWSYLVFNTPDLGILDRIVEKSFRQRCVLSDSGGDRRPTASIAVEEIGRDRFLFAVAVVPDGPSRRGLETAATFILLSFLVGRPTDGGLWSQHRGAGGPFLPAGFGIGRRNLGILH